ncbi:hypothetical protein C9374_009115 [Naegleria lovaniensis]|uniref:C-factor n=1 Tax=Naegleria lovaniensis TaxID=51637 RepID=A0AA88GHI7_NAELO|nr:uncharacterized protein C9374_009115 [Naegleria lovaniensis]KAG2377599.1 hypothetical protein C9374_009115 [Naegleria lovaniensis]
MSQTQQPRVALVTGANKGIGLAFVKLLLSQYKYQVVMATARNPHEAYELKALQEEYGSERVPILTLDVSDEKSVQSLPSSIPKSIQYINLLINNAGYLDSSIRQLEDLSMESMLYSYKVNCVGPMLVCKYLKSYVKASHRGESLTSRHGIFAQISTRVASVGDNRSGGAYPYRCSKAALNMATKNLALELEKEKKAFTLLLHPGMVYTDMTKNFFGEPMDPKKHRTPEMAASDLLEIIHAADFSQNGKFISYDKSEIEW